MLQFGSDPIAIVLGEVSHALALGQILAHEPVGVLVGASLSVVVRRGKVEPRLGRALERPVLVKLGAVVHGDRLMKRLMQKLLATRVRPLLHLSVQPGGRRRGVLHYGRARGLEIVRALRGWTSGLFTR